MGGKKRQAKDQKEADEAEQLQTLGEAAGAQSAYRPHQQQALNAALQQQLSAFQGTNSLLGQMGLQGFGDGSQYGNVVSEDMMKVGQTSQAPGFASDRQTPRRRKRPKRRPKWLGGGGRGGR